MDGVQPLPPLESTTAVNNQEWDDSEDYEEEDDEEEDNDSDIDAEAQEIARKLGEQLWADLNKASGNDGTSDFPLPVGPPGDISEARSGAQQPPIPIAAQPAGLYKKAEEEILATMKALLALLETDPLARSILSSTIIPGLSSNVLEVLHQSTASATVSKTIVVPLSQILVALARSEQLFGNLRHSNASALQLDKGKRKRDEVDGTSQFDPRVSKRPYVLEQDLQTQVIEAVRAITQALSSASSPSLDPALVSSIRFPLHQVFLFAVTSSAGGGPEMHALQEISGLIQVIGVLSGIQIGQPPETAQNLTPHPFPPGSAYPWMAEHSSPAATDIGTAVYPCLIAGCRKIFSRLYGLRAHQRNHAVHRPFRCGICPASFARNHDLKRHIRLHDRKAWKCAACQKIFSRRDAFKRHKNGSKARGPRGDECTTADVIEVELDEEDANDVLREERRAKLWTGLANSHATGSVHGAYRESVTMEEGEIPEILIQTIQGSIMSLHGLLQIHVGSALGVPAAQGGHPPGAMTDPTGSQATLASVIARAQSQNLPLTLAEHQPGVATDQIMSSPPSPTSVPLPVEPEKAPAAQDGSQDAVSSGTSLPPLSMYGLSDEQTKLLELAIANAALAAQAQAEAEAALEEEDDYDDDHDDEEDYEESTADMADPVASS